MEYLELNHEKVLSILPDRDPFAHKGKFGKILLLCGARGYTGAAALAARGALRCGAGLVFLGVPECIYAIEAIKLNEPVVFPLPDRDGTLSPEAVPEILERLKKVDEVSYVRYASVYRSFKDLSSFMSELKMMMKAENRKD